MRKKSIDMIQKTLWALFPLASLLLLSCSRDIGQPVVSPTDTTVTQRQDSPLSSANLYVDEETAALLDASLGPVTKSGLLGGFFDELGVTTVERLFPDSGEFDERHRAAGLHRWYRITYDPSVPVTKAGDLASHSSGIRIFEHERPIRLYDELPFDDPRLPDQWQYYNDGSKSNWKEGADLNVLPVWKDYTTGSQDVVVAVVDSGVDHTHEDLAGVVNRTNSWNFCENNARISPQNHGTHVAGIIGAINNNGIGVSGIAGGDAKAGIKGVTIISCQIIQDEKRGGDAARALVWAADHGAVIANNSWGFDYENDNGTYDSVSAKEDHEFFEQPNEGEFKHSLKDAIDYFNKYAGLDEDGNQTGPMAGGAVFFAAGNEAWEYGAPACYPGAIAVGSYGPAGTKAYYSNFGTRSDNWVDIAAPGGDYHQAQVVSTITGNSYAAMQGTSMACPMVSGVAALVVSALGGPGFTRGMLVEKMLGAQNPKLNLTTARIGIPLDALGAVTFGADPEIPADVTTLTASAQSNTITAAWNVTESANKVTAFAYRLFYGTDRDAVIAATAVNPGEGVSSIVVETGMAETGEVLTASVNVDFEKTYFLKVTGYDYGLNYSGNSNIVSVETPANNAPVIKCSTDVSSLVLRASQTLTLDFSVEDPDGHEFTVTYEAGSKAEEFNATPVGYILKISAPETDPGTYEGMLTATDSYGKASTVDIRYRVLENTAPESTGTVPNILIPVLNETRTISLSDYFKDSDGDELTYAFQNSSQSVVHITGGTDDTAYLTSLGYGLATITVTASDARNATATQSFKVLVRDGSRPVDLFPNPVKTTLTVLPGESGEVTYRLSNKAGAVVRSGKADLSPFDPLSLDMGDLAAGTYYLYLKGAGLDDTYTIVKI